MIDEILDFFFAASDWQNSKFLPTTNWWILQFFAATDYRNSQFFAASVWQNSQFFFWHTLMKFTGWERNWLTRSEILFHYQLTKFPKSNIFLQQTDNIYHSLSPSLWLIDKVFRFYQRPIDKIHDFFYCDSFKKFIIPSHKELAKCAIFINYWLTKFTIFFKDWLTYSMIFFKWLNGKIHNLSSVIHWQNFRFVFCNWLMKYLIIFCTRLKKFSMLNFFPRQTDKICIYFLKSSDEIWNFPRNWLAKFANLFYDQ